LALLKKGCLYYLLFKAFDVFGAAGERLTPTKETHFRRPGKEDQLESEPLLDIGFVANVS